LAAVVALDAVGTDAATIGRLIGVPEAAVANLLTVARDKLAALEREAGDVPAHGNDEGVRS
jgi:DNA-directed RNA polymerase specialized sigma24 family protein